MARWRFTASQKHLDKLLEEATVDCYDEYEAFTGVVVTLADNLPFPFEAKVIGETVEVIGLDDGRSNMKHGIIANVRKGKQEYKVAFSELKIPKKLKTNKWFELYEYWARGF